MPSSGPDYRDCTGLEALHQLTELEVLGWAGSNVPEPELEAQYVKTVQGTGSGCECKLYALCAVRA